MVDKAIFVSTGGTEMLMRRMEVLTNNLANAATPGFRADFTSPQQTKVGVNPNSSRIYASVSKTWSDYSRGPITTTGRDLDVAINGPGFIAVQSASGREGYTRAGNLHIRDGLLVTGAGQLVMGSSGGIISMPQAAVRMTIADDGTVSVKIRGVADNTVVGRIKLVKPPQAQLQKGEDGLIYLQEGGAASKNDDTIRLTSGALEGSNVNTVKALTDLVELSRQFEMQTRLMKSVQENADKANQIMTLPS